MECSWNHEGLHVNFARDPKYSCFHEHTKNWIYYLYLYFIKEKLINKIFDNLGGKTILYLIFNHRINGFCWSVERKSGTANGANKKLVLHVRLSCGSVSIRQMVEAWCFGCLSADQGLPVGFLLLRYSVLFTVESFSLLYLLFISWFICSRRWCIDKLGVFHANQTSMCLDSHLNQGWGWCTVKPV